MVKTIIPVLCIAAILSVLGGLLLYMQTSPRFEVVRIGIRGHARLTPESIVEQLNIQSHTNIFQIQLDTIQQKLESMQWVKKAEVYRNFPNKLNINLSERTPFALIKLDELHLVDQDGVVLGALASGSAIRLPIITGAFVDHINLKGENPQLGQALHAIYELMHSPNPLLKNIRKIRIECLENATFLSNDSFPEVRVSLINYQQNLQHLEKVYSELKLENLASIDLRFDKRIIVTPNKS
jgi:cell division protein FtsQ